MKLKVHLVFDGCCEEALTFYKEALGGEVAFLFRKKEDKGLDVSDEEKEKISHMVVKTTHFELAGEDASKDNHFEIGNNTKLVLSFDDLQSCRKVFETLSVGAKITMPFEKTFFCDGMGELTDRYGISWIVMMSDEGYEG